MRQSKISHKVNLFNVTVANLHTHTHTHIFYSIFHTTGSNSRDIEPKVVIIGAGPAGLAVSIAYLKETFCVTFTFCFLSYNRLQVQFKRKEFLVLFLKKNPQSLRHGTAISTRFILLSWLSCWEKWVSFQVSSLQPSASSHYKNHKFTSFCAISWFHSLPCLFFSSLSPFFSLLSLSH